MAEDHSGAPPRPDGPPSRRGETGTTLGGRYRLLQALPSGLSGDEPWAGVDTILDRPVRIDLLVGPRTAAALDAARRAALVTEPRLTRVLHVGQEGDLGLMVSERIEGRTLAQLAAAGPLAPDQARAIIGEVAAGLEEARRRGLHHLALRPSCVLVSPSGRVSLRGLTVDGALAGFADIGAHAASRRDAIDLVRLLYAALTGHWPEPLSVTGGLPTFAEWSDNDKQPANQNEPDQELPSAPLTNGSTSPPTKLVAGIPADLDTLCAVTLGPHEDGPHSPGELVRELEPWRAVDADELFRAADAGRWPALTVSPAAAVPPDGSAGEGRASELGAFVAKIGAAASGAAANAVVGEAAAKVAGTGIGAAGAASAGAMAAGAASAAATAMSPAPGTAPMRTSAWPALTPPPPATGSAENTDGDPAPSTTPSPAPSTTPSPSPSSAPSTTPSPAGTPAEATTDSPAASAVPDPTSTEAAPACDAGATPAASTTDPLTGRTLMKDQSRPSASDNPQNDEADQKPEPTDTAGNTPADGPPVVARQSMRVLLGKDDGPGTRRPGTPPPASVPLASTTALPTGPAATRAASTTPATAAAPTPPPTPVRVPVGSVQPTPTSAASSGGGASGNGLPFDSVPARTPSSSRLRFDPSRWIVGLVVIGVVVALVLAIQTVLKPWGSGSSDNTAANPVVTPSATATSTADVGSDPGAEPAPVVVPTLAAITTIDTSDDDGEHEELIARIWDGDPATAWYTHTYNREDFSGMKDAVGIVITLTEPATVTAVTLEVNGSGGNVEVRSTDGANPTTGDVLAAGPMNGHTVLTLSQPTQTQSLVLWFTSLAQTPDGGNRIEISELSVS